MDFMYQRTMKIPVAIQITFPLSDKTKQVFNKSWEANCTGFPMNFLGNINDLRGIEL